MGDSQPDLGEGFASGAIRLRQNERAQLEDALGDSSIWRAETDADRGRAIGDFGITGRQQGRVKTEVESHRSGPDVVNQAARRAHDGQVFDQENEVRDPRGS